MCMWPVYTSDEATYQADSARPAWFNRNSNDLKTDISSRAYMALITRRIFYYSLPCTPTSRRARNINTLPSDIAQLICKLIRANSTSYIAPPPYSSGKQLSAIVHGLICMHDKLILCNKILVTDVTRRPEAMSEYRSCRWSIITRQLRFIRWSFAWLLRFPLSTLSINLFWLY